MNILLAAAILVQDKTAEETFKKIEGAFLKAKTLNITFKSEVVTTMDSGQEEKQKFSCTLFLKEGDKINLALKDLVYGKLGRTEVSNGDRKRTFWESGPTGEGGVEKGSTEAHASDLARIGGFRILNLPDYRLEPVLEKKPEDSEFKVHDFAWGDPDKETRTITYKAGFPRMDITAQVKLNYDPKTFKLLKRVVSFKTVPLGTSTVVTDTYEELTLNADIPDEKFKLPEEKK